MNPHILKGKQRSLVEDNEKVFFFNAPLLIFFRPPNVSHHHRTLEIGAGQKVYLRFAMSLTLLQQVH